MDRFTALRVRNGQRIKLGQQVWCNEGALRDGFRKLYNVPANRNTFVVEMCDVSTSKPCWNLGIVQKFNNWELEEVTRLHDIVGEESYRI